MSINLIEPGAGDWRSSRLRAAPGWPSRRCATTNASGWSTRYRVTSPAATADTHRTWSRPSRAWAVCAAPA